MAGLLPSVPTRMVRPKGLASPSTAARSDRRSPAARATPGQSAESTSMAAPAKGKAPGCGAVETKLSCPSAHALPERPSASSRIRARLIASLLDREDRLLQIDRIVAGHDLEI